MRRLGPVLTLAVALLGVGACSSSDKASVPDTTTSSVPGASTGTTTTTEPATTSTTNGGATTSTSVASTVFTSFTVTPPSPVECNAPTMIELKWTASGVTSVTLSIDGLPAGTFGGGPQDHLQYFACDGKTHTYTLTAKKGSTTETVSRDVVAQALN